MRDFQAVEAYMDRVHKMVQEVHQAGASPSTPKPTETDKVNRSSDEGRPSS